MLRSFSHVPMQICVHEKCRRQLKYCLRLIINYLSTQSTIIIIVDLIPVSIQTQSLAFVA